MSTTLVTLGFGLFAVGATARHGVPAIAFQRLEEPASVGAHLPTDTPWEPDVLLAVTNLEALDVLQQAIDRAREMLEPVEAPPTTWKVVVTTDATDGSIKTEDE